LNIHNVRPNNSILHASLILCGLYILLNLYLHIWVFSRVCVHMQFIYKSVRESEDLFFVIWRDKHDKWIIMTLLNANREFFEDMKYYVVHLL
jgi:hypothetical protein